MARLQTVPVRFYGEVVGFYADHVSTGTLYKTPQGLYRVHVDMGSYTYVESGHSGEGLTEEQVRTNFPNLLD